MADEERDPAEPASAEATPAGATPAGATPAGATPADDAATGPGLPTEHTPANANPTANPEVAEADVAETFDRTIDEGKRRLSRSWSSLCATGFIAGVDVGTGVLALLVIEHVTGSVLLGGLGFAIGFISLTMARSELFTEDFFVPVAAVVARKAPLRQLLRLWTITAAMNLVGGWIVTGLIVAGYPDLSARAAAAGSHYIELGLGWRAFALALLGGTAITLMTWMQHSTTAVGVRLVPAIAIGFLLAGAQLNHAIVSSLLLFAGLHTGMAPYSYLDWAASAGWAALGNIVGGLGLVTLLRLVQLPSGKLEAEVRRPAPGMRPHAKDTRGTTAQRADLR